ncbi:MULTISPECIES: NAD/NADP-dependent octopine/nopaline dehydrogenase family protein [Dickeya]|uniref:NAD/NADP-dependent octopine/nopaline dehydrogenase family protein n=1 Tax=Dickeya TaxID=204037 RepID=UPI000D2F5D9D|nr:MULTISPECIES: NAD/NADP-dependent octopine/nopaline dehydrogenase family protein [Dickeya]MBO8136395.1 NAD/NADP octopine/nopaline dehydrogenase family protein [Dickeya fangzhongdai]ULR29396.1 NAD/NADP octopine/nopaline dehydrogenase family protein [Dickeya fangzhongdai]UMB74995.1 NAD/NADP octopine/nopaline dehydrogenase family protein [Dickeya fangzhongdai]
MKVAILGAGNIGLASAGWLAHAGHTPVLWSAVADELLALQQAGGLLTCSGVLAGQYRLTITPDIAKAVADAQAVLLCVPGYGHRAVMDALAPHLQPGQSVIINSACSLSALYLADRLAARGLTLPIITWGTTLLTARRQPDGHSVALMAARQFVDVATVPVTHNAQSIALCAGLFGARFRAQSDVLATSLININPIAHLGLALCNVTRIERHESWPQYHYLTDGVARLIGALERERQQLAAAFDLSLHSIEEHFRQSFDLPQQELADIAAELHRRRGGPAGPQTLDTRFILEDTPYGLVFAETIARYAGLPLPLHTAAIHVASAIWGQDLRRQNNILPALALDTLSPDAFRRRIRQGYA